MTNTRSIPLSAAELTTAMRDALPYDPKRLDRVLRVDERHGLVEVQAATPWQALAAAAFQPGDARNTAVPPAPFTVGESLAVNAAGPDGRPAVTHVETITVVMPNGELRRTSRTAHRDLFALIAGGLGLFGAIYSVTLSVGSLLRAVREAQTVQMLGARSPDTPSRRLRVLVPPEKVEAFLADARARCDEWRLPLEGVELRRTAEEKDSFLRWARRDYTALTLHLAMPGVLGVAVRTTQLRRSLIDAAMSHGGSFLVPCMRNSSPDQIEACYPELRSFLAEKRRIDPAERLTNPWYRHYRNLFTRGNCRVRWSS
jgi:hypothetical protein